MARSKQTAEKTLDVGAVLASWRGKRNAFSWFGRFCANIKAGTVPFYSPDPNYPLVLEIWFRFTQPTFWAQRQSRLAFDKHIGLVLQDHKLFHHQLWDHKVLPTGFKAPDWAKVEPKW